MKEEERFLNLEERIIFILVSVIAIFLGGVGYPKYSFIIIIVGIFFGSVVIYDIISNKLKNKKWNQ